MSRKFTIGVVGNPNCGKTTLFNTLTGSRQRVGNWPGVTVERKTGRYLFEGAEFELVDLPGTYSLDVGAGEVSLDEQIARDYVAAREADLIVNIVDASSLERNLYLTAQLIEMRVPMLVALNMMDAARQNGLTIDAAGLADRLGCPVIPVVATSGEGISELRSAVLAGARDPRPASAAIRYGSPIEAAIAELVPQIAAQAAEKEVDPHWLALRLLEGDDLAEHVAENVAKPKLDALRAQTAEMLGDDIDISIADARYGFVNQVTSATVRRKNRVRRSTSDTIDRIVLNRALGIPIFLLAMYLMFLFTINIGGAFIDFFDIFTGTLLVDGLGHWLVGLGAPDWLVLVLADGLGGGVQVVATFIPVIAFLYLAAKLGGVKDLDFEGLPDLMEETIRVTDPQVQALVPKINAWDDTYALGYGATYPFALESALKLKEITYAHCEGMLSTEFKHGPLSAVTDGFPVLFLAGPEDVPLIISGINEVTCRGGDAIAFGQADERLKVNASELITFPESHPAFAPLLGVLPLQLLSYHMAVARGIDPDFPRNLSKTLTVD